MPVLVERFRFLEQKGWKKINGRNGVSIEVGNFSYEAKELLMKLNKFRRKFRKHSIKLKKNKIRKIAGLPIQSQVEVGRKRLGAIGWRYRGTETRGRR